MQNITISKAAQIAEISGLVYTQAEQDQLLSVGGSVEAGAVLELAPGSEIVLVFADGSEQRIVASAEESQETSAPSPDTTSAQTAEQVISANDQAEIDDIQALIESGDDIELPDTAAGGLTANEGTDFVTLDRDGNELLAEAGYDTTELDNTVVASEEPELNARSAQPTITQSDTNTIPEDTVATGNVLDNDSDLDDTLSVQSFTVAGDPVTYLAGQTAIVEGGSFILNQDGSYSFTPAEDYNGELPVITYTTNTNASDTLTIIVTPVSDLVDADEVVSTAEDTAVSGNLLTNASSADGTPQVADFTINGTTFAVGDTAQLTQGDLTVNQDGSYTFTPAANFNGAVPEVSYTVADGVNTDISTLNINVTPASDLVDADEVVSTAEDTAISGNLLTNASSADGTPQVADFTINGTTFAVGDTAQLTQGDLTVNQDGSYTFTPAANFNGAVPEVSYTVADGVNTDISTLNINVTPASDLVDADEVVSTAEDTAISGNLLINASSADGTPQVADFTINGTTFAVGDTAQLTEGDLTVNQDGSYTFTPAANFNGAVPEVTYTVADGVNTDISTLNINVTPASDLVDADEVVSTAEDAAISGNLLTNASSADGTPQVADFTINGTTFAVGDTAQLTQGDLTVNQDGSYTFTPAANFNGAVPEVSYTVADSVNTDISTLNINVTPASDLVDADEVVSTAEDTAISGNLLINASSADGTPQVADFTVNGTTFAVGDTAQLTQGDLTVNQDGSYTFTPAANFNGAVPEVTYTVADGVNTDISTLNINVTPASDLTDADEVVSTSEDTAISGNLLTNASSADGTPQVADFTINGTTFAVGDTAQLTQGDLTVNQDGSYTFTPAANFNGAVPEVTYTVADGVNTDISTLNINVTPASDLTDADEVVSTAEDTAVSGNLLTNASSADGTPQVADFTINGTTFAVGDTAQLTQGDLTVNQDGSYTFTPAANFNGAVPEVTYTVADGVNTDISTLNINVTPASDLVDANEVVSTAEETTVSGNLLVNASSADGTPEITGFTVAGNNFLAGQTANLTEGDLTINQDGSFTFAPAANYNGPVPVATYTVDDGVNTDTSTLTINVTPVSDLTDADETVSTQEDTNVSGNVLTNASSADGTPLITSFVVAGSTQTYAAGQTANLTEGDLTINQDGSFTFAPAANYNGPVPVATYTVDDGVNTDTSTLTINVTPVSDLTDADESVSTQEDTQVTGSVLTNASSADGTPVVTTFTVAGLTATFAAGDTVNLTEGDLTINADGSYTFTPAANYNGPVPVATYTVEDGVNTDTSTLTINVTPVSDLTDADETVSTQEDTQVTGSVLTNASSADGTPVVTTFTVAGQTATFAAGDTVNLTEGDLTVNADGSYTFTPAANYNGPVPVATYTVDDGVNTDTSTLTINVTPVSDLTDADESVSTQEDTQVTGSVLTNASSADGTPVVTTFTVAGQTATFAAGDTVNLTEGDLTINADGSYTFTPAANYNGPVPVATYTVEDGVNTDTSTLTINVTPVSDLTDADESVSTQEDTQVTGSVLTNASSADGTPVVTTFTVAGQTATFAAGDTVNLTEGDLTINADGSYTFTPAANYNGPVPVATYTVSDGVNTDTSTLTINVTPVSDLTDADESVSTQEDTQVTGSVLTNASSADGTPVVTTFTVAGQTATFAAGDTVNLTEGDLTINADGSYTFTPAANYNGPVPVATYTVSDGVNTDTSTLTINVTPVSDLTDADETVSTQEDTQVSGSVLTNASSADGTPVVTTFTVAGQTATFAAGDTVNLTEGDLTINADGSYTFTPAANYNGPVPVATYTVSDGVNTDTSTLTINVTPVSDLTDADETVSTQEDTQVSGSVLTNASSADGTPVVTTFTVAGLTATFAAGDTVNLTEGDLTINADGSYTFTPAANYNGPVPVATYTVSDGVNTDTSTLTINVTPVSDLTDADESVSTQEDTQVTGSVLTNASSADGTPVVTTFTVAGQTATFAAGDTVNLTEGDLTINADGSYTFTPAANYNGPVPVATYTVSDGVNTDTSTLTINVTPVSDLTDADETVSTQEDTQVSGSVLTNASSADGTPVVTTFTVAGQTATFAAGDTVNLTEGDLTINADGSYTFTPAANYNGPVPVATYTVSDGVNTDTSTLTINVTPVSDLTDADETVSTQEDTQVSGSVLTNASSADGTPVVTTFTVAGLTATFAAGDTVNLTEGDLTINADGSYTFTPAANYNGPVPVATYTVSDGVNTDTSTLTINVTPVSDLTDADESVSTQEDTQVTGSVLTNASSADGTPVVTTFTVAGQTATFAAGDTVNLTEGDLTINADGSYTFTPAANYNGPVPVATYTVSDGVNTDTSTLTINVTPVSDLTDADETVSTQEDTQVTGSVLTNASSADGTPVVTTFTVAGLTATFAAGDTVNLTEGDLTINADGSYTFTPAANYNGPVPVATYTVDDGVNTDTSTLTINVTPVNDPPVAADDNFSVEEGSSVSGNVISHNDGDGVIDTDGGDGATLVVTQVNGVDLNFDSVTGIATVAIKDGTLSIKQDGSFTYNNDGFALGSAAPTFDYTLSDGTDVDTATVTIDVLDQAPDARDDFNYIELVEAFGSGKAFSKVAQGNVVEMGSSGDKADTSADGFGTPILTQVEFAGVIYAFSSTVSSLDINTDYGTLNIKSDGTYRFVTPSGLDMPDSEVNLNFTYTIQDADAQTPEEDSAVLNINITTAPTAPPPAPLSLDLDTSSDPITGTIDTDLAGSLVDEPDDSAVVYSTGQDTADIQDILIDNSEDGLDKYLAVFGSDESADTAGNKHALSNEGAVVLEQDLQDAAQTLTTTVTNGLLADGGLIVSDAGAEAAKAPISEIDSPELL